MTTVRYNPNQPANEDNPSALAYRITRDARREMFGDRQRLTPAERDDLTVIYNTARETAEEGLGAFDGKRLSERDALALVRGKMAAGSARFENFQRMTGVRMQSSSSEVLARFLNPKRNTAAEVKIATGAGHAKAQAESSNEPPKAATPAATPPASQPVKPYCPEGDPLAGIDDDCVLRPQKTAVRDTSPAGTTGTAAKTPPNATGPAKATVAQAPAASRPVKPPPGEHVPANPRVITEKKPAARGPRSSDGVYSDPKFGRELDGILSQYRGPKYDSNELLKPPVTKDSSHRKNPVAKPAAPDPRVAAVFKALGGPTTPANSPSPATQPAQGQPDNGKQPPSSADGGLSSLEGRTDGSVVGIEGVRGVASAAEGQTIGPATGVTIDTNSANYRRIQNELAIIDEANFETFDHLRATPPDCVIVICGDPRTGESARKLMLEIAQENRGRQLFRVDPEKPLPKAFEELTHKGIKIGLIGGGIVELSQGKSTTIKFKIPMALNVTTTMISPKGEQIVETASVYPVKM